MCVYIYIYITVNFRLLFFVLTIDKFTVVLASWLIVPYIIYANLFMFVFVFVHGLRHCLFGLIFPYFFVFRF